MASFAISTPLRVAQANVRANGSSPRNRTAALRPRAALGVGQRLGTTQSAASTPFGGCGRRLRARVLRSGDNATRDITTMMGFCNVPKPAGLYDPAMDKDACGVRFPPSRSLC